MLLFLFALSSQAQYSCLSSTPLIVNDSVAMDTFSHSGNGDRWFTFSLTDSVSNISVQWEWASKNANVPYDSLIIYTDSCSQLIVYDTISTIPLFMNFQFNNVSQVFLRFLRADNAPQYFEFDLGVYDILDIQNCDPSVIIEIVQMPNCIGEQFCVDIIVPSVPVGLPQSYRVNYIMVAIESVFYGNTYSNSLNGLFVNTTNTFCFTPDCYDSDWRFTVRSKCTDDETRTFEFNDMLTFELFTPDFQYTSPTCEGTPIVFNSTSNCAQFWHWDFGDGQTGTGEIIEHTYDNAGTYFVTLTIANPDPCNEVSQDYISITKEIVVSPMPIVTVIDEEYNYTCFRSNWEIDNPNPNYTYNWYMYDVNDVFITQMLNQTVASYNWMVNNPNGGYIIVEVIDSQTGCSSQKTLHVYPCCNENDTDMFPNGADHIWTDETISTEINYSNEVFIINGDVILDGNYEFTGCEIYLAPYSSLIIGEGEKTFSITTFTNCRDTVWKEIKMMSGVDLVEFASENIVEFSVNGIVNQTSRPLFVTATAFINNYEHSIFIDRWILPVNQLKIENNSFSCNGGANMIYPYVNKYPKTGVVLRDNSFVGSHIMIKSNTFTSLRNGIYAVNSDFQSSDNTFSDITHFGQYDHTPNAAIYAEGFKNDYPNSVIAGGNSVSLGNSFNECLIGVYVKNNYNVLVNYNNFNNQLNGTAIRLQNMMGYIGESFANANTGLVENNTIINYGIGVSASSNNHANIQIKSNTITGATPLSNISRGIVLNGVKTKLEKYVVENNQITFATYGISANNTYGVSISNNSITSLKIDPNSGRFGRGIHVAGSDRSSIIQNIVIGEYVPQTIKSIGIHVEASLRNDVFCNELSYLGACFRGTLTCTDSRVYNNKFENALEGITLSNAGIIGPQGSLSRPSDNQWLPSVTTWTNLGRWPHFTYASNGNLSTLFVKQGATYWINPDPNAAVQGDPFSVNNNATGISGISCSGSVNPKGELDLNLVKTLIDEDASLPVYEEESYERAKSELLYILPEDSLAMEDVEIQQFVQQMDSQPKGKTVEVHQLTEEQDFLSAKALNLSIQTITQMEETEKNARMLQLDAFENGNITPDDISQLEQIAQLCPYTHGQGVYIARALLSTVDPQYFFINECETDPSFVPRAKVVHVATPQMLMYPNPADNIVYFELMNATNCETANVRIADVTGKILIDKVVDIEHINSLDVSGLSSGCYSFTLILKTGQTFSEKICLIK